MSSFNSLLIFIITLFKVLLYQPFARYSSSYPHLGEFLHQVILLSRVTIEDGGQCFVFPEWQAHFETYKNFSVKVIFQNEHELIRYILFSLDCIIMAYTQEKTKFYFPGLKVYFADIFY